MKLSLLLFLLASFAYLRAELSSCTTGVILEDHAVDIMGSLSAGAEVALLKLYNTENLHKCLEQCCSSKYGSCTISSFTTQSGKQNCYHYTCYPLQKCKYAHDNKTDTFTFPLNSIKEKNKSKSKSSSSETVQKPDGIHRSITPRKGVKFSSSISDMDLDILNKIRDQFGVKNDNTTIKPRKGVDFFQSMFSTEVYGSSSVKPRKGVVETEAFSSVHDLKSKVKPRKGVEPFIEPLKPTPAVVTTLHDQVVSNNLNETDDNLNITDFEEEDMITMLQHVFEDDANNASSSQHGFLLETVTLDPNETSSSDNFLAFHSILANFSYSSKTDTIVPESVTINYTTLYPEHERQDTSVDERQDTSVDERQDTSVDFETTLYLSSSFSTPTPTINSESIVSSEPSDLPSSTSRSKFSDSIQTTLPSVASSKISVAQITPSPSQSPTMPTTMSGKPNVSFDYEIISNASLSNGVLVYETVGKSNSDSEADRRYKSSMHIVLSLVFGLLVLCTVLGVIAKRIYDVWLRRHYHRMDFLIDGMYDNYS